MSNVYRTCRSDLHVGERRLPLTKFPVKKGYRTHVCRNCYNRRNAMNRRPHLGDQVGLVPLSQVRHLLDELLIRCGTRKEIARRLEVQPVTVSAWYGPELPSRRSRSGKPRMRIQRKQLQKVLLLLKEVRQEQHGIVHRKTNGAISPEAKELGLRPIKRRRFSGHRGRADLHGAGAFDGVPNPAGYKPGVYGADPADRPRVTRKGRRGV